MLGYYDWLDNLERGLASHHAGLLPAFKEVVEELFQRKLVKVVFATETLALGINMPARTVVLEKLEKFNGEARVAITSGEYTQITGRAGRRGIDVEGHAVIQWTEGLDPQAVAALASRRTYPLNSSFRPTYNMAVNLIDQFGRGRARQILESSFAQFQADRAVVGLARQVREQEESLAGYEKAMTCDRGDFTEYSGIRRDLSDLEKLNRKDANASRATRDAAAARARQPPATHAAASVPSMPRSRAPRAVGGAVLAAQAHHRQDAAADRDAHRHGRAHLRPRRRRARRARLRAGRRRGRDDAHPVRAHDAAHLRRARPARRRVAARRPVESAGCRVPRRPGVLPRVRAASGRRGTGERGLPRGAFRTALSETQALWQQLDDLERDHHLPGSEPISAGLAQAMHSWARGGALDRVLDEADMAAGDFVRWAKQTIDLLDQLVDRGRVVRRDDGAQGARRRPARHRRVLVGLIRPQVRSPRLDPCLSPRRRARSSRCGWR